jgi:hypothetical protein
MRVSGCFGESGRKTEARLIAMTRDELRATIELKLLQMHKWEERDYELERAFIDLLETDLRADATVKRAMELLAKAMLKAKPEGNA